MDINNIKNLILKYKKWAIIGSIAFVVLIFGIVRALSSGRTETVQATPKVIEYASLHLEVDFEENLLLSKYGVRVLIDKEEIGTIDHGKFFEKKLDKVEKGKHKLIFSKLDKSSVSGTYEFELKDDLSLKLKIKSHSDNVEILSATSQGGVSNTEIVMGNYVNMNLKEAVDKIKALGIKTIKKEAIEDSVVLDETNWVVVEQNIKADTKIDKSSEVVLKALKTDKFLNKNLKGLDALTAISRLKELNFTNLVFELSDPKQDVTSVVNALTDQQKVEWKINDAYVLNKDEKKIKLIVLNEAFQKAEQDKITAAAEKLKLEKTGGFDLALVAESASEKMYYLFDYDSKLGYMYIRSLNQSLKFEFTGTLEEGAIYISLTDTPNKVTIKFSEDKKKADQYFENKHNKDLFTVTSVESAYEVMKSTINAR